MCILHRRIGGRAVHCWHAGHGKDSHSYGGDKDTIYLYMYKKKCVLFCLSSNFKFHLHLFERFRALAVMNAIDFVWVSSNLHSRAGSDFCVFRKIEMDT